VRALLALARRRRHDPAHPTICGRCTSNLHGAGETRRSPDGPRQQRRRAGPGLWLGLALVVILADQVTKTLILGAFQLGDAQPVTVVLQHRACAQHRRRVLLPGRRVGLAALVLRRAWGVASGFIVWMLRSHPTQKLFCFAVSMIMGGALGNVIDRLLHGYVVDFLQFRFELAGAAVPRRPLPGLQHRRQRHHAGAICLILDELLRVKRAG
jgi:signal peptidase II